MAAAGILRRLNPKLLILGILIGESAPESLVKLGATGFGQQSKSSEVGIAFMLENTDPKKSIMNNPYSH